MDPGTAYAGAAFWLFRTDDAGAHWTALPRPSEALEFGLQDVLVDARDPDLVFAGTTAGVFRFGATAARIAP